MSQPEQLAREIAREVAYLPERWRLWLFEQLRDGAEAADMEQHQIDRLNQKMSEAVEALDRVAEHLDLRTERERLGLTMKVFDAAPDSVRQGWKGRRIGEVMRGSWSLAKAVAFQGALLPVESEYQRKRSQGLSRKRREGVSVLYHLERWLQGNPAKKTMAAYSEWREQERKKLQPGQKAPIDIRAVLRRWPGCGWAEILQAVEEGRLPGTEEAQADEPNIKRNRKPKLGQTPDVRLDPVEKHAAEPLLLDAQRRGKIFQAAREARGLSQSQLSQQIGMERSSLEKIETGEVANSGFQNIAKLADALNLSLDALVSNELREATDF